MDFNPPLPPKKWICLAISKLCPLPSSIFVLLGWMALFIPRTSVPGRSEHILKSSAVLNLIHLCFGQNLLGLTCNFSYRHTSLVCSIFKAWRLSLIDELTSKGWDGYDHNPDHCCHVQVGKPFRLPLYQMKVPLISTFICSKWGPTEHASCFLRLLP